MTTLLADLAAFPIRFGRRPAASRTDRLVEGDVRRLPRDAVLRVERPLGRTVRCIDGSLWITFDGDRRDVIVNAGGEHRCERGTMLMIQALGASAELRIA
jgi:hypothetical protein